MTYLIVESRSPLTDGVLAEGRVAAPRFFRLLFFFPALSPKVQEEVRPKKVKNERRVIRGVDIAHSSSQAKKVEGKRPLREKGEVEGG